MYFVARSTTGSTFVQYLHAVNIVDGSEVAAARRDQRQLQREWRRQRQRRDCI